MRRCGVSDASGTTAQGGQVIGTTTVIGNLDRAEAGAVAGARRALGLVLHLILQRSTAKVPWEEGDLSRDGAVVIDEAELVGAVTYGNTPDTAKYAVPQHENLEYRHDGGKEAKFLESAVNQSREQARNIFAHQVSEGMAGGGSGA